MYCSKNKNITTREKKIFLLMIDAVKIFVVFAKYCARVFGKSVSMGYNP
jgi:hypothetical protein